MLKDERGGWSEWFAVAGLGGVTGAFVMNETVEPTPPAHSDAPFVTRPDPAGPVGPSPFGGALEGIENLND